jgi:hypothetical protein
MLRFPNPGSTINNFVAVYNAIFERLRGQVVDLDDIVEATVEANLATSCGHMGQRAIARSTRADRSRDPLYNQLKMYAELFRSLGWLHPTEEKALNFTFTLLGHQVVAAGPHYLPLLEETVLGISYPSHVLTVMGHHDLRPFSFILQTMMACGNALSRDEMIVGPLSASSDREPGAVANMAARVEMLRESPQAIQNALERLSRERKAQTNTLKNYTRWPIAIMRDCGWTGKDRLRFRRGGKSFEAHKLTEKGRALAQRLAASADIRVDQVDALPFEEKAAISLRSHYSMLEQAGFDLETVRRKLALQSAVFDRALDHLKIQRGQPLIFSPFQSLSVVDIQKIFPASEEAIKTREREAAVVGGEVVGRGTHDHLFVKPRFVPQIEGSEHRSTLAFKEELRGLRRRHRSDKEAAAAFALSRGADTQVQFYPLVSQLFRVLGFKSDYSRAGVNYQRWDACVWLNAVAVPIEIKSPTEEAFLSTKAIRQALENKIILLARGGLKTSINITSLIVGYQLPNERGEMSSLIDDIFSAFSIKIGVIDLSTLALLAIRAVTSDLTIEPKQLGELRGFLHV